MSNTQGSFNPQFEVNPDQHQLQPEHCRANEMQIKNMGRDSRQQVRIEYPTTNGILGAIYTVSTAFLSQTDRVILGNRILNLNNCQLSKGACMGEVKAQIMLDGIKEEQAKDKGEFMEHLSHDVQNDKLVVIASHGGDIEHHTDVEAEYVANHFSCDRVSLWLCKGFSSKTNGDSNEDALMRWHITATEINPKSFPKLNTILRPTPTFDYSIAFHGWKEDSICVGGNDKSAEIGLIGAIKDEIVNKLPGDSNIVVKDSDCRHGFNGDKPENIVNRLGTHGIQIEQCGRARRDYHDIIAQAVVDIIGPRING